MKYKVGDKVTVRSDLKWDEIYGEFTWFSEMDEFLGKEYTISNINDDYYGYYNFKELTNIWCFTDDMLEDAVTVVKHRDFSALYNKDFYFWTEKGSLKVQVYDLNDDIVISISNGDNLSEIQVNKKADESFIKTIFGIYGIEIELQDRKKIKTMKEFYIWMQDNGLYWNGEGIIKSKLGLNYEELAVSTVENKYNVDLSGVVGNE